MRRNRTVVILAFACALMGVPARAYASDGFLGGLQDLTNTREVETQESYEESYQESYEPEMREGSTDTQIEIEEGSEIQSVIDASTKVKVDNSNLSIIPGGYSFLNWVFGSRTAGSLAVTAIGVVFLWWGVRKSAKVVMSAFRKGRITT